MIENLDALLDLIEFPNQDQLRLYRENADFERSLYKAKAENNHLNIAHYQDCIKDRKEKIIKIEQDKILEKLNQINKR